MSLENVVAALVTAAGGMTGITRAYADPPESISEFPAAIVYAYRGELSVASYGVGKSLHTVVVEIHHSRQVAPQAINDAKVWPDRLLAALYADQTLGGAVDGIVWPVTYRATPIRYANEVHYGVRFEVTVKTMETL